VDASAEAGSGAGESWRAGGNAVDASADAGADSVDRRGGGDGRCSTDLGVDSTDGVAAAPSAAKRARTDGAADGSWQDPVASRLHCDPGASEETRKTGMETDGPPQLASDGSGVGELHPSTSQEATDGRNAGHGAELDSPAATAAPPTMALGTSSTDACGGAGIEAAASPPFVSSPAAKGPSASAAEPAAAEPRDEAASKSVAASPGAPTSEVTASGAATGDATSAAPDWVFSEQPPQVAESRRPIYRHVYVPGPGRRPAVADPQRVNKQEQLFAAAREAMEEEQRQRSAARAAAAAAARVAPAARTGAGGCVSSGGASSRGAGVLPSSAQLASADPYVVLGLSRDSEPGAIRTRFKELARLLHPDKLPRTLERRGLLMSSVEAPAGERAMGLPGSAAAVAFRSVSAATAAGGIPWLPGAAASVDGTWCSLGAASAPPALSALSDASGVGAAMLAGGSGGDAFVLVQRAYQTLMAACL